MRSSIWTRLLYLMSCVLIVARPTADALAAAIASTISGQIPDSTIWVIDSATGTSAGTAGHNVKVAVGDVVSFRFPLTPVSDPNLIAAGIQSYLTAYVPPNTEVVGVRLTDTNGRTVPPRHPGISVESGTGASISQLHADTGLFFTSSSDLRPSPEDQGLSISNGIDVFPSGANDVAALLGGDPSNIKAHNGWDVSQVFDFGAGGLTPSNAGSPVAGGGTFYQNDASAGKGPWQRARYPGSLIGFNAPGGESLRRTVSKTDTGFDITPNAPLPWGTTAVRVAMGEVRLSEPLFAEIRLRVLALPLNPPQSADVICAEVFGAEPSKLSPSISGPGAANNPWYAFFPVPACAALDLKFEVVPEKYLFSTGESKRYLVAGKNLRIEAETNVAVYLGYDVSTHTLLAAAGNPVVSSCPNQLAGLGLTCRRWDIGTFQPSSEFDFPVAFSTGTVTSMSRVYGVYVSSQHPQGSVSAGNSYIAPIPALRATAVSISPQTNAGHDALVTVELRNDGTGSADLQQLDISAPDGFSISSIDIAGGSVECLSAVTVTAIAPTASCVIGRELAAGASTTVDYRVSVPPTATSPQLHEVDLGVWARASGFGGSSETLFPGLAVIPIGAPRSAAPTIQCPTAFDSAIAGGTSEADGTQIRVYFNLLERSSTTSIASSWTAAGFVASFGALYPGLDVRASAQAPGELESPLSEPCSVTRPNRAPVANDDTAQTTQGMSILVDVASNDVDPDGNLDSTSVVIPIGGEPSGGTATPRGDGSVLYAPAADFTGQDSFTYRICDAENACDVAGVTVSVVATTATLSGRVIDDRNNNGIRDVGEPGLSGWTVYLDNNGNDKADGGEPFVLTDGSGGWIFPGLTPGTYTAREVLMPGWICTAPSRKFKACEFRITVLGGQISSGHDFGNHRRRARP